MRAVVQRVSSGSVSIAGKIVGEIGRGLVILLGVKNGDTEADAKFLADKCVNLRIFNDEDGSRNDMGIYGWIYPMGETGAPTIPVVNSISVTPTTVSPSGTITINASGRIGE